MSIKHPYKEYFQKSRVFLYPALGIPRVNSIAPICTYSSWEGYYTKDDVKLICLYHLRNDQEFRLFEKNKLFGNSLFHDFKEVIENKAVYVFDFKQYLHDWNCFNAGKYSKMTDTHKKKIKAFYGPKSPNYAYVESFLYPEKYYSMYSEMINVDEKLLKSTVELCDKPDPDQEKLTINLKSLEMKRENS